MNAHHLQATAAGNLQLLSLNPYVGRGFVLGVDETGKYAVSVYWIQGRSPSSRNRIFVQEPGGILRTEAFDPTQMSPEEARNTIYTAMNEWCDKLVVSNGNQTDNVIRVAPRNWTLLQALHTRECEDDAPNFTPRITGVINYGAPVADVPLIEIVILKKSPFNRDCTRHYHTFQSVEPGYGYNVNTYMGDAPKGQPLTAFVGEPQILPLIGDQQEIARNYWEALSHENRVSLAVKFTPFKTGESTIHIINRNQAAA